MEVTGFSEILLFLYDLRNDNLLEDHKRSCSLSSGLETLHVTVLTILNVNLQAPCVLYIGTGVSLLSRERFLYI